MEKFRDQSQLEAGLMELSRKRKKELRRLRSSAEELWQEQQEVLDHASTVLRQASKQANILTHEQVLPAVKTAYDERFRPSVDRGVLAGRTLATGTRARVVTAVSGVVASALTVLEASKSIGARLEQAGLSEKVKAFSSALQKPAPVPVPVKRGPGAGTYALIGVGVLALTGVAYAAWQTFRADDDLWIADDEPEATGSTNPTDVPQTPTA
jgi:hypothetical protein